jgi:hypothetical protein
MQKNHVPLTEVEEKLVRQALTRRESLAQRFPLIFGLTATFGLVSVLYGFEKLIDRVELFVNNPWILLVFGIALLLVTGAAYKKLN